MAAIEVTPAGMQLYEVVVTDTDYESHHEVSVPDELLGRLDTRDLALQDLVLTAMAFLLDREGQDALSARIDLGDVASRYEGFVEELPRRARERSTEGRPPTGQHVTDRDAPAGDDRLRADVERDQAEGRASRQERRL